MGRFIFFLLLALVILFLVFGWKDKVQFLKKTKTYQQTKKTTCQVKNRYHQTEKWVQKQNTNLKKVNEMASPLNKDSE